MLIYIISQSPGQANARGEGSVNRMMGARMGQAARAGARRPGGRGPGAGRASAGWLGAGRSGTAVARLWRAAALLVCLCLLLAGCSPSQRQIEKDLKGRALTGYTLTASLDPEAMTLTCTLDVDYVNPAGQALGEVLFHLYPNAFSEESWAPFASWERDMAYPEGFSPGGIRIERLAVDGQAVDPAISGAQRDLLTVALPAPLDVGGRARIEMDYRVTIPRCEGRFGYGENTVNLTNCYPVACVWEDGAFDLDGYAAVGDPFYSDLANYQAVLSMPASYQAAFTGMAAAEELVGDRRVYTVSAPGVRDFAWIASPNFLTRSARVDGVQITSYTVSGEGSAALDVAKAALRAYNRRFGRYPYPTYSVVACDFYIGGMEYPNLVMIDQSLYHQERAETLEFVVAHETAHQWWYQMVGNDEVAEPWLDESLTNYSALLYYLDTQGPEAFEAAYEKFVGQPAIDGRAINLPVSGYSDLFEYNDRVYNAGSALWRRWHALVGEEAFNRAMSAYFQAGYLKNASYEDLLAALESATGQNWRAWFDRELAGGDDGAAATSGGI